MIKSLLLSCAVALAAGAIPAQAQQAPGASPAPTTTTPTTTTTTTAPGATVSAPGQPSFGQLMSSLAQMKSEVAKVQQLRALSTNDVRLVKVQSVASGSDTAALNNALSRNASQLAALRGALARVPLTASTDRHTLTFAEFLSDNKLSIDRVVAADVNNGSLVAFIQ